MSQAERLTRASEILVELFRSPVPTHFFQTLGDRAGEAVPNHYLAVCLQDSEKSGYLVHSLASLDEAAPTQRVFALDEGLPGRAMSTGKPYLIDELIAEDGVDDLEGVLAAAGLRAVLVVPIRRGLEVALGSGDYGRGLGFYVPALLDEFAYPGMQEPYKI